MVLVGGILVDRFGTRRATVLFAAHLPPSEPSLTAILAARSR